MRKWTEQNSVTVVLLILSKEGLKVCWVIRGENDESVKDISRSLRSKQKKQPFYDETSVRPSVCDPVSDTKPSVKTFIKFSMSKSDKESSKEHHLVNPSTPNDAYRDRSAPLTSKRYILYIYSTNIGTEYFKRGVYTLRFFFSKCSLFHNSNIFGSCIIHTLYIGLLKLKKNNSGAERLTFRRLMSTIVDVPHC